MPEKHIPWLQPNSHDFPDVSEAWEEPDGILAAGGDLSISRLVNAYRHGIFPWYNEGEPILWWSPNPRCVLIPNEIKVSKSLGKIIRSGKFIVTFNQCFSKVIASCASPRETIEDGETGTWISNEMQQAYIELHKSGHAHSVECWLDDQLVGGLYGLAIGKVFFGESMFSAVSNASKVAFATLCEKLKENDFQLIDGQVYSNHLSTLGFKLIDREEFVDQLSLLTENNTKLCL